MEYQAGRAGRVFAVRFDEGEDFLAGLEELARREQVRCGWFYVLGGLRGAEVVIGPREPVTPPDPVWQAVHEAREMLGVGSLFWEKEQPKIHLHAALGHHGETLTACVRRNSKVYLVLEVCLLEITGITATRPWVEAMEISRLTFGPPGTAR